MPIEIKSIVLEDGTQIPRRLDIEAYFVRFTGEGDGLTAPTSLEASFITKAGSLGQGQYLRTESAGRVALEDAELKAFPHYAALVEFLGNALYSKFLAEHPELAPE